MHSPFQKSKTILTMQVCLFMFCCLNSLYHSYIFCFFLSLLWSHFWHHLNLLPILAFFVIFYSFIVVYFVNFLPLFSVIYFPAAYLKFKTFSTLLLACYIYIGFISWVSVVFLPLKCCDSLLWFPKGFLLNGKKKKSLLPFLFY